MFIWEWIACEKPIFHVKDTDLYTEKIYKGMLKRFLFVAHSVPEPESQCAPTDSVGSNITLDKNI